MGANQDAVEVGTSLGVDPGLAVTYTAGAVDQALRTYGRKAAGLRAAAVAGLSPQQARAQQAWTTQERAAAAAPDPTAPTPRPTRAPRPTRGRRAD